MNIKVPRIQEIKYRVYDRNGMLKREIEKAREKIDIENDEWLKGVSCFVVNEENEVLIERRVNRGLTPGKLDLCSGHIDNSEVATQAMIRELNEELGIKLEESINVKKLTSSSASLNFGTPERKRNFFIDFFCLKRNNSKVIFQKEEIQEILWVPLEECFKLIKNGKTKFPSNYDYEQIFKEVIEICSRNKEQKKIKAIEID